MENRERETLGSRAGFLLLAAGCSIGLGNIWRFPFITGQYGGANFVFLYIIFLVLIGFPVLVMELAVGRAARKNIVGAMRKLPEKHGSVWSRIFSVIFLGNLLLMMFYTTVCGWFIAYTWFYLSGNGMETFASGSGSGDFFAKFVASPANMTGFMAATVIIASIICMSGLKNGVERITKILMSGLFILLLILVANSLTLPNAMEGVKFYLYPTMVDSTRWMEMVVAALGQAFFTLSLGVGSMGIFGSYIEKTHSLTGESILIIAMDTLVALMAGMIIFPACAAYDVSVNSGPDLIFVTLPKVFANMMGGQWWGMLFFLFMGVAAFTTVIAVFENIIGWRMDEFNLSRKKAALINMIGVGVLSLPCALGFNLLSGVTPFGSGSTILDLEDFIVSGTLLPIGSVIIIFFCTWKFGWGWKNFIAEADYGKGLKYPAFAKWYIAIVIPAVILFLLAYGYYQRFAPLW